MYKKVKTAGKYFSIFHSKALKTFAQIGIFRFENKPSGNPGIWQSLVLSCFFNRKEDRSSSSRKKCL
jgi:hypothetical protein